MPRPLQHIPSPSESFPESLASWLPPVPDDEDLALGWECACPALQIERWLPDANAQQLAGRS